MKKMTEKVLEKWKGKDHRWIHNIVKLIGRHFNVRTFFVYSKISQQSRLHELRWLQKYQAVNPSYLNDFVLTLQSRCNRKSDLRLHLEHENCMASLHLSHISYFTSRLPHFLQLSSGILSHHYISRSTKSRYQWRYVGRKLFYIYVGIWND